eukprot:TRINITY_DN4283_c0_g1_i1.p1 TRINITY_DN4283_c0_g1~~TRINITY_DN4283_c0_g1_i1.p1  ORF type:complete len:860 (+),score=12.52 TRINITY_DN4283_c0_g1_i1:281-2581(+)
MKSILFELFFRMTYLSSVPSLIFLALWTFGKLLLLSPPLVTHFANSKFSFMVSIADGFNVLLFTTQELQVVSYLDTEGTFITFSVILFIVFQVMVATTVFVLIELRFSIRKGDYPTKYSFLCQVLHLFSMACANVLLQLCTMTLSYSAKCAIDDKMFSTSFKQYIALVLSIINFVESIGFALSWTLFCHDRSIRKVTLWGAANWYCPAFELLLQIVIQVDSASGLLEESASHFLGLSVWGIKLAFMVWFSKYTHRCVDMAEFFCATYFSSVYLYAMLEDFFDFSEPQYVFLFLVFSSLFCIIRSHLMWVKDLDSPKAESAQLISDLLSLALHRGIAFHNFIIDHESTMLLVGLLSIHSKRCPDPLCVCKPLLKEFKGYDNEMLKENAQVFSSAKELQRRFPMGKPLRIVRLLISELASAHRHSKDIAFDIALSEASFYYFGNPYYALEQLLGAEVQGPSAFYKQQIFNLKRMIHNGLVKRCENEDDPEHTRDSIAYLKYFHRFLDQVEDSVEATKRFWFILLEPYPSAQQLNMLGQKLFESKYRIMHTVEKISKVASNHTEFLIRYGLFMKFIMHDHVCAEQAFYQISSMDGALTAYDTRGFSIFRPDVPVMLMVSTLEHTGSGTVSEINTELERGLEYSRENLIGMPVTRLMPPSIAKRHAEFVQRFYNTMDAKNINKPRCRFVKHKSGLYVPCRMLKKIVPSLSESLRIATFMIMDRKIGPYTSFRRDKTYSKVKCIWKCNRLVQLCVMKSLRLQDLLRRHQAY